MKKISVIVCTYNRSSLLKRALSSLARQELPAADFEVLAIDNASTDNTATAVRDLEAEVPGLRYVYEASLGLSNARNRGFREAAADIVAFMDDDAEAEPGWLAAIARVFERETARPLCVGGKVVPVWEKPRPRWLPDYALGPLTVIDYGDEPRPLDFPKEWAAGCNIAFDRDYLIGISGFNPLLGRRGSNLLSNEETAVLRGIQRAGGLILYEPAAVVRHLVPASRLTMRWHIRRMFAQGVSDVLAAALDADDSTAAAPGEPLVSARGIARQALALLKVRGTADLFHPAMGLAYYLGVAVESAKLRLRPAAAQRPRA